MISEPTTIEQNKLIYRNYIEDIFNRGNLDKLHDYLAPSYVYRDAPPGSPTGPEGVAQIVKMFRTAFPDLTISFDDQISDGDKVCSRTTTHGTHEGSLFGIPPSHKTVAMPGITIVRIIDGLIVESWVKNDVVALLKQIGATSLPK